jgi:hypothetical protein
MSSATSRLRDALLGNLGLKAVSLLIAGALWYAVYVGPREGEMVVTVPVSFAKLAPGYRLVGKPVDSVRIWLSGPRGALALVDEQNLRLEYDLSGVQAGIEEFTVDRHDLGLPRDVRMLRASPGIFFVKVRREAPDEAGRNKQTRKGRSKQP